MSIITAGSSLNLRIDDLTRDNPTTHVLVSATSTAIRYHNGDGFDFEVIGSNLTANGYFEGEVTAIKIYSGSSLIVTIDNTNSAHSVLQTYQNVGSGKIVDGILKGANVIFGGIGDDYLRSGSAYFPLSVGESPNPDIVYGGAGSDTIVGDMGNDHLYGQSANGGVDGADLIVGLAGSDYIQGNAGNDTLRGGDGSDRIQGGRDEDSIQGDAGNDTINGNLGADTITGDDGSDYLRGGRGDDVISGADGDDILSGDLDADTMTGGAGVDLFMFGGNAAIFNGAAPDQIWDFQHGSDHLAVGYAVQALLKSSAQPSFASAAAAAQQLFDGHAGADEVAVVLVGTDSYLFYSSNNGTAADSAVRLSGVDANLLSLADFQ